MALREDMHSLVDGIVSASEARAADLATLRPRVAAQRDEARRYLGEVHTEHQTMAGQLRERLDKGRSDVAQEESRRSSQVRGWLGEITAERKAAQTEWQSMVATMQSKRGYPPKAQASSGLESPHEFAETRDRFFRHLASHPDGARLAELEREFGMSRFAAARFIKGLVEQGKAEKRGQLYFAL